VTRNLGNIAAPVLWTVLCGTALQAQPPAVLDVFTSEPGITVWLGDRRLGEAPLTVPDLQPGEYILLSRLPDGSESQQKIVLRAGTILKVHLSTHRPEIKVNTPGKIEMTIQRAYGRLIVAADHPGLPVMFDNKQIGCTTLGVLQVPAGTHEVAIGPVERKVEVSAARCTLLRLNSAAREIEHKELEDPLVSGFIDIQGPSFLYVRFRDDAPVFVPVTIGPVPIGKHDLQWLSSELTVGATESVILSEPYSLVSVTARVEDAPPLEKRPSESQDIAVQRALGQLMIAADQPGVSVVLDGVLFGETTLDIPELSAGTHDITIGKVTTKVKIIGGECTLLLHKMHRSGCRFG